MNALHLKNLARLLCCTLPFLVLVLPHIDLVPLWDGAFYAETALQAIKGKLNVLHLNAAGHPGIGSLVVPTLMSKMTGGELWGFHLGNMLLGIVAIISFLSIVDVLFAEVSRAERFIIALVFSAMPVIAANALNPNLDFGTLVFFLLLLCSLLRKRFWVAALAGAMLVLAKESGVVVWGATIFAYTTAVILRREGCLSGKARQLFRMSPVLLGLLSLVGYVVVRLRQNQGLLWAHLSGQEQGLLQQITSFSLLDPVFHAYLAVIFLLNFTWIPLLFIGVATLGWVFETLLGVRPKNFAARRELIVMLAVILVVTLTRFKTYANARYFLPIAPVLILAFAHALQGLVRAQRARFFILGVTAILFFASAFRTIDPLARAIFGTFDFGFHKMLRITSITKECCGAGRDQLVYNLEFTRFHDLLDKMFFDLKPSDAQPLVMSELANWYFASWVTTTNPPQRAIRGEGVRSTPVVSVKRVILAPVPPQKVFWANIPNIDGAGELELLKTRYMVVEERRYESNGYVLSGLLMMLK